MDLADRLGVQPRAAVGQVVAGDAGDGGVLQAHRGDALGDPARLVGVEVGRLAGVDLAEVAAPGALVAADEEGGLAVFPALVDVGAAGLFADGVQALAADQRLQLGVLRAGLQPGLDPLGLALDRHLAVADLEAEQFAAGRLERGTRGMCRSGRLTHDLHGTRRRTTPPLHEQRGRRPDGWCGSGLSSGPRSGRLVRVAAGARLRRVAAVDGRVVRAVALGQLGVLHAQVGVRRGARRRRRLGGRRRSCRSRSGSWARGPLGSWAPDRRRRGPGSRRPASCGAGGRTHRYRRPRAANSHGQRRGFFSAPTPALDLLGGGARPSSRTRARFLTAVLRAFFAVLRALRVDFSAAATSSARRASSSLRALSTPAASVSRALSSAGVTASRAASHPRGGVGERRHLGGLQPGDDVVLQRLLGRLLRRLDPGREVGGGLGGGRLGGRHPRGRGLAGRLDAGAIASRAASTRGAMASRARRDGRGGRRPRRRRPWGRPALLGGVERGAGRLAGRRDPGAELLGREAAGLGGRHPDVGEALLELGADDLTARLLAEHELHLRVDRLGDHPARSGRRAHPERPAGGGAARAG